MKRKKYLFLSLLVFAMLAFIPVNTQAASVKLNKTKVTLSISGKKTVQLKAVVKGTSKKVRWKSSNTRVAVVSSKGKVTAKKSGTAVITAKVNGKTARCKITVRKTAAKVTDVKQTINYNQTTGKGNYILKGLTKSGKVAWKYTTGIKYRMATPGCFFDQVFKNYVYIMEDGYFIKLNLQTGKAFFRKYIGLTGAVHFYVDSDGTMYGVNFDNGSTLYVVTKNGTLKKKVSFAPLNGGTYVSGKVGGFVIIKCEYNSNIRYVYVG